jgi:ATP-dependent Clp protease ATP-binding subunit ClpA
LRNPHCILLLDEIEKAHEDIYNILLQVMDHATLTDNNGRKADFRHVILIMTTNTGARDSQMRNIGFGKSEFDDKSQKAIEKVFSPEFRNRLSATVKFNSLSMSEVEKIVDKMVAQLKDRVKTQKVEIQLDSKAREYLAKNGFDPQYGARPIKRKIEQEISLPLSKEILFGQLKKGGIANITVQDDHIVLDCHGL